MAIRSASTFERFLKLSLEYATLNVSFNHIHRRAPDLGRICIFERELVKFKTVIVKYILFFSSFNGKENRNALDPSKIEVFREYVSRIVARH